MTDQEIIDRYINGEEKYFNILFKKYNEFLKGHIYKVTKSPYTEDVVQEAWINAYINIDKYKDVSFFAWIYKIAYRLYIDLFVRGSRNNKTYEVFEAFNIPDEELKKVKSTDTTFIIKELSKLPEIWGDIVFLKTYGNYKFHQMNINKNTATARYCRGIKKLKENNL